MIQVVMRENAVWAYGHSSRGPKGRDVVCAAVSMLMEATAAALEQQNRLALCYFSSGFGSIIATEDCETLEVARQGFLLLAQHCGNDVKVRDLRTRRIQHA